MMRFDKHSYILLAIMDIYRKKLNKKSALETFEYKKESNIRHMCGIAGLFSEERIKKEHVDNMIKTIKHRGPDNQSSISLNDDRTWLGHARLSIIDLSKDGNQPMKYMDDRYFLTYNGEVYNFIELRNELQEEGLSFNTNSDSEVILASYVRWGKECVNHFNGMFSFVIVDRDKHKFFAARDRFGVKPLFYWQSNNILAFASEIKEFTVLPGWTPEVNGQRAYDYLQFGLTDHTNETLFQDVYQIRGGEYAEGSIDCPIGTLRIDRWYIPKIDKINLSYEEAVHRFRELFFDANRLRLRADVSVGSCLSGGLDSSSIVCTVNDLLGEIGQKNSQKTVSALATGTPHDESKYIDYVLKDRELKGYYVNPSPEDLWSIKDKLIWHQDEPFGSTSIYAQWCVFQKASDKELTVMLDGQGADELLAGYMRFFAPFYSNLFFKMKWGSLAKEINYAGKYHNYTWKTAVKGILKTNLPSEMLGKAQKRLSGMDGFEWYSVDKLDVECELPKFYGKDKAKSVSEMSEHLMLYNNMPMLLRYEDRNSMAHSVESRLPFLDYRLVEFVQSLPDDYKIREGQTKAVLRDAMDNILPRQIRWRMDKIGFETPEEKWEKEHPEEFRTMIRDSIEKTNGIINSVALDYFDKVVAGNKLDFTVWRMINFGIWYDMYINQSKNEAIK